MENKTPYPEIFLAVEEAFGKTPTNGEIDDFVTELSKMGIVLTKFHPMTERPREWEPIAVLTPKGLDCVGWNYSNGMLGMVYTGGTNTDPDCDCDCNILIHWENLDPDSKWYYLPENQK